jgi:hypothetical protein
MFHSNAKAGSLKKLRVIIDIGTSLVGHFLMYVAAQDLDIQSLTAWNNGGNGGVQDNPNLRK